MSTADPMPPLRHWVYHQSHDLGGILVKHIDGTSSARPRFGCEERNPLDSIQGAFINPVKVFDGAGKDVTEAVRKKFPRLIPINEDEGCFPNE